jgi:hypothetical protein
MSEESAQFLEDSFWWFFCQNFQVRSGIAPMPVLIHPQKDAKAQDQMFGRMAGIYFRMCVVVETKYKDQVFDVRSSFLQRVPRALANCIAL